MHFHYEFFENIERDIYDISEVFFCYDENNKYAHIEERALYSIKEVFFCIKQYPN